MENKLKKYIPYLSSEIFKWGREHPAVASDNIYVPPLQKKEKKTPNNRRMNTT